MKHPYHIEQASYFISQPEKITLPAKEISEDQSLPTIRIFLGSEDAQYRAERIFIYSIEQFRDPGRCYEIYIMKNISGFDRSKWRTGFTLYRYAIPEFAEGKGKAIYNDVDQIYLEDPAKLFDLDMKSYGYMSVSNTDTSVMLIDCKKMLPLWNLENAKTKSKEQLNSLASSQVNLWGKIDPQWNARDQEYQLNQTKVLHYTMLHQQPWQPSPESYSYHPNPLGKIWFDLESKAISEQYKVFTQENPTQAFQDLCQIYQDSDDAYFDELTNLDTTVDKCHIHFGQIDLKHDYYTFDLALHLNKLGSLSANTICAYKLLERIPQADTSWVIEHLFSCAKKNIEFSIDYTKPDSLLSDGYSRIRNHQTSHWWKGHIVEAAKLFPNIKWDLRIESNIKSENIRITNSMSFSAQKTVWALNTHRHGDNAQINLLSKSLPWQAESKKLRFRFLNHIPNYLLGPTLLGLTLESRKSVSQEPWPDCVISSGRRSAPVAKWIKKASKEKTRLIHIGRPWCSLKDFDLILTSTQYQLPLRSNVIFNSMPLNEIDQLIAHREAEELKKDLDDIEGPYLTVILGGKSRPFRFNKKTISEMAIATDQLALNNGYSLLVCTSPRTPKNALPEFIKVLESPYRFFEWKHNQLFNPYKACIELADAVVLTGDSASMVAEVCKLKQNVFIQRLPKYFDPLSGIVNIFKHLATFTQKTHSYRGTPKQQGKLARLFDICVENGWITSIRDLDLYFDFLKAEGRIAYLDELENYLPKTQKNENAELETIVDYITHNMTLTLSKSD